MRGFDWALGRARPVPERRSRMMIKLWKKKRHVRELRPEESFERWPALRNVRILLCWLMLRLQRTGFAVDAESSKT